MEKGQRLVIVGCSGAGGPCAMLARKLMPEVQVTVIRKFFLHVSKEEQRKRFVDRIERPDKNWKFSAADVEEREYWDEYQDAYEDMIRHTATPQAPWYVIPADRKWLARALVAAIVVETLKALKLDYPAVSREQRNQLKRAAARLRAGR